MSLNEKKPFIGARIIWIVALLLGFVILVAGPGVRLGLWEPIEGFMVTLRWGMRAGLTVAGLSLLVVIYMAITKNKVGMGKVIMALVIGLLMAAPMGAIRMGGGGAAHPIHDITTDMVNPPEFIALVGKRGDKVNSIVYAGEEVSNKQKEIYPDITSLMVSDAPGQAFAKALEVAEDMGWELSGVDEAGLRFEGTARTVWYGFVDDVVVTIKATDTGSQIDMRSVSRVGGSDFGVNAARIRTFLAGFAKL